MIGELQIDRVAEYALPFPPQDFFVGLSKDALNSEAGSLGPDYFDKTSGMVLLSSHSWVIRTKHHNVLIDTCVGNHKKRLIPAFNQIETPYLERLAAVSLSPDDIDFVICTHLHFDHIGWNTKLENGRWVPTFSKARYLFGSREFDNTQSLAFSPEPHGEDVIYKDSILPVAESGQMVLVEDGYALDDNLVMEAAPGHTPGHMVVRAKAHGKTVLFVGDLIYHPIQTRYPEVNTIFCADPQLAVATRRRYLGECADNGHLLAAAHLGAPHYGRISRDGDAFRFHPGHE
ncbi:glyoxylase-like metal-dependent hydrolase (beta-lactamase superfamily II) [Silvibacterium bohemicum]|uniref:Glyoxylase-like metal-dependent hydrolase (Beta-lactamase superfamily II) n=2 Tax=Silvibacterium bohemicum TaxID=1577686 RepID=A0A841JYW8_9BACT|nr:glyoxylase-like metal-dependent hydrolase (beta-lactamase superfamily II) [Silvibacterium bohemicum]